jgi:Tfp pilus assembly protein PilF
VAYVGAGDLASARKSFAKAMAVAPEYVRSRLNGEVLFQTAEMRQRFTTLLRVAGDLEDPKAVDAYR